MRAESRIFPFTVLFVFLLLVWQLAHAQDAPPSTLQVTIPPPAHASALELEETADTLRAQKDYGHAIVYLRAAMRLDPQNAVLWNKCAIAEIQLSQLSAANKDLKHALKLNPKYAAAFNNMGVVYYLRRDYKKAVRQYEKAIQIQTDNASFYANLGTAWFARKKIDKAAEQYAHALGLDPDVLIRSVRSGVAAQISSPEDRAHFSYVVAKVYAKQGDIEHSIEFLRRAKEQGYSRIQNVYTDPEFAYVRLDPRFAEIGFEQGK